MELEFLLHFCLCDPLACISFVKGAPQRASFWVLCGEGLLWTRHTFAQ